MCLYWYHSSVPEARSAGRIRRWPTANFPPSCSLLPPFPPSFSLSLFLLSLPFLLCCALPCVSLLSSVFRLSPSEVTAPLLVMTLSTDRSDIRRPRSTLPGNAASPPYMHNSPTVPLSLPWNASLPHPLSLVFSFCISSSHFVTEQKSFIRIICPLLHDMSCVYWH